MVLQTLRTPAERKVYLFSHPRSALTVPKLLYKLLNKNGQRVKRSLDYKRSKKRETSGHCATLIHSRILHGDSSPIDPTRHFGHGARILHSSSSSQSMTEKLERIFVAWTRRKGDELVSKPHEPVQPHRLFDKTSAALQNLFQPILADLWAPILVHDSAINGRPVRDPTITCFSSGGTSQLFSFSSFCSVFMSYGLQANLVRLHGLK